MCGCIVVVVMAVTALSPRRKSIHSINVFCTAAVYFHVFYSRLPMQDYKVEVRYASCLSTHVWVRCHDPADSRCFALHSVSRVLCLPIVTQEIVLLCYFFANKVEEMRKPLADVVKAWYRARKLQPLADVRRGSCYGYILCGVLCVMGLRCHMLVRATIVIDPAYSCANVWTTDHTSGIRRFEQEDPASGVPAVGCDQLHL